MTHPFHPLVGQEFSLVCRRHSWETDWVYFLDEAGALYWLPSSWTDAVVPDPAIALAGGRAAFLLSDLVALATLVRERSWR